MRICSLLPSGTEILFELGLGEQIIGVTEYCLYPPEARSKPIVSRGKIDSRVLNSGQIQEKVAELAQSGAGTFLLDAEWLERERPDLIISQDMCRVCDIRAEEVIRTVDSLGIDARVLVLKPSRLADIMENVRLVGQATQRTAMAEGLASRLEFRIGDVGRRLASVEERPRALCLEWLDPLMAGGHWIPEMVALARGEDGLGEPGGPVQRLEWSQVLGYAPEFIFLIPCAMDNARTLQEVPYLASKDGWSELPAVRGGNVYIVNSDFYSVPGPRVVTGLEVMAQLIHPDLVMNKIPADSVLKLHADSAVTHDADSIARRFRPYINPPGGFPVPGSFYSEG